MREAATPTGLGNVGNLVEVFGQGGIPSQDPGPDDQEGNDRKKTFVVQLVLDRLAKNTIESMAFGHAIAAMDGCRGTTPAVLTSVVGNPLRSPTPDGQYTLVVFGVYARSEEEVRRQVIEAVTETAPAPFDIADMVISQVIDRDENH